MSTRAIKGYIVQDQQGSLGRHARQFSRHLPSWCDSSPASPGDEPYLWRADADQRRGAAVSWWKDVRCAVVHDGGRARPGCPQDVRHHFDGRGKTEDEREIFVGWERPSLPEVRKLEYPTMEIVTQYSKNGPRREGAPC